MATKKTEKLSIRPKTVMVKPQTGSDNTYYADWSWSKDGTDHYEVKWYYYTGDNHAFSGTEESVTRRLSTYSPPSNAKSIGVKVRAIGKNYSGTSTPKWRTDWTNEVRYYLKHDKPSTPGTPTTTMEDDQLTVELNIDPYETNCRKISFSIFRENGSFVKSSPQIEVKNRYVRWTTTVERGDKYKARAFGYNADGEKSDPSDYSGLYGTIPNAVSGGITLKGLSETSVRVEWTAISSADAYQVEYATDEDYFDSGEQVSQTTSTTNYAIVTGLESGKKWFFRVRATNNEGESEWTGTESIILGEKPSAPTTWSSTTTVIVGEDLYLYWVHNSEDGSSQETATLELTIGGVTSTLEIVNNRPEDEKDQTSSYKIETSSYTEGTEIKWRVKTKGITPEYSDWSVLRTVDVYARPSVNLSVTDSNNQSIETLSSYPINVKATTSPATQKPLSYHLSVIANESYEAEDELGNFKMVLQDSEVYRGFFDISTPLNYILSAGDIDLENGISYTVKCVVAMDSGLTAEDEYIFDVNFENFEEYYPELNMVLNEEDYSMTLQPYCAMYPLHYYKVEYRRGLYIRTDEEIEEIEGEVVEGKSTTDGDQVYQTVDANNETIYFTTIEDPEGIIVEGVTISVYRREFDGSFVELAKGLNNSFSTYIVDDYPSLDHARYRVIATNIATGSIIYTDVSSDEIDCPYAIIQWDRDNSEFGANETEENGIDSTPVPGSILMIKGNIDVSDKHSNDVSLIEYIGRKHPISYYGTQLGHTSSWNMEIPKDDTETLYILRKLASRMGDCYVREPSGSGYWANVKVGFNQRHCEPTIPITLDITRVTGGE